ncbi:MAG: hypothetical protein ABSA13_19160 [Beijerinckiaceae bacterium]|jgi:hypothetical protein
MAILEKLAYGAGDWAALETIRAHRRKIKDDARLAEESPDEAQLRSILRETLPLRRILRIRHDISNQELFSILRCDEAEIMRLRRLIEAAATLKPSENAPEISRSSAH